MSEAPITQAEMIELFGERMPIEAVMLVWEAANEMTIGEIRAKLRQMALKHKEHQMSDIGPGFRNWIDDRPPYEMRDQPVLIKRRGSDKVETVIPSELPDWFNVAGLWWKPIHASPETKH